MTDKPHDLVPVPRQTPIELQVDRLVRQFENTGLAPGEPMHDALVSTAALAVTVDFERANFKRQIGLVVKQAGDRSDEAVSKVEAAVADFTIASAELRQSLEAYRAEIQKATRTDVPAFLGRAGRILAFVAVVSGGVCLLAGSIGGYALGDRRAIGSQLTIAEQLRQTFGIDALSAATWAPVIALNDPRVFVQRCMDEGYRRRTDGRRVCEVTLAFPPPETPAR